VGALADVDDEVVAAAHELVNDVAKHEHRARPGEEEEQGHGGFCGLLRDQDDEEQDADSHQDEAPDGAPEAARDGDADVDDVPACNATFAPSRAIAPRAARSVGAQLSSERHTRMQRAARSSDVVARTH
jgi:hypothetical protein